MWELLWWQPQRNWSSHTWTGFSIWTKNKTRVLFSSLLGGLLKTMRYGIPVKQLNKHRKYCVSGITCFPHAFFCWVITTILCRGRHPSFPCFGDVMNPHREPLSKHPIQPLRLALLKLFFAHASSCCVFHSAMQWLSAKTCSYKRAHQLVLNMEQNNQAVECTGKFPVLCLLFQGC